MSRLLIKRRVELGNMTTSRTRKTTTPLEVSVCGDDQTPLRKRRVKHFVDDLPSEVVFLDFRTNFCIWLLEIWGFHWLHLDASNDTVW